MKRSEERVQVTTVFGDVEPGVVAQIDRGEPEILSETRTVGGLFLAALTIRVQPPRFFGLTQAVEKDRHLRSRCWEGDREIVVVGSDVRPGSS